MSIEQKPNTFITNMLLRLIRTYLKSRSEIVIERNDAMEIEPPYIILGNHVNNWDPFFVNYCIDEPISFIAADSLFYNPFLKGILDYIGIIPKTKRKSDISTIRGILKAKKHRRVIGLFPEGNITWDGCFEPIDNATAKLIKLLNIPVVIATISGGHLSHPRWAKGHRKGLISISLVKLWDSEDLKEESIKSIHQKLNDSLSHDEMEWQSQNMISYRGRDLANYLERLLFICPHCKEPSNLYSDDDLLHCKNCNYTVRYTALGTLEQVNYPLYFTTTRDWNRWQLKFLKERISCLDFKLYWDRALQDDVKLFISDGASQFKLISIGNLMLKDKSLIFESSRGNEYEFSLEDIRSLNIHLHNNLNFFYKDKLYRLKFYLPRTSAYKWLNALEALQGLYYNQTLEDVL